MSFLARRRTKKRLATLLTRSIFLTIAVLSLVVVLQNYQVNRQVVSQEVARSKLQTQSLVQQILNFGSKPSKYSKIVTVVMAHLSMPLSQRILIDSLDFLMVLIKRLQS